MTTQDNKQVIRQFIQTVWNEGHLDRIEDFVSPTYQIPGGGAGPEGVRQNVSRFRSAFSDLVVAIADTVAEGDTVVTWLNLQGTNTSPFKGYPPSGNGVKWWEIAFWQIKDGKIVGGKFAADMLGLRQGVGALPQLPKETWTEDAEPEN
jgi:predicted ester cyclase